MWYYWFTLIFNLAIVLMAIIIIPWIIIALGIETIRERIKKPRKSKEGKPFENVKWVLKLTGALLAFALVSTFLGYISVPYLYDFPHVIQREYSSKEGYIDDVYDPGKSWDNEVEVNGELFYSTKIKEKHEGRYMTFEYLPNTKLIVSYKLGE